MTDVELAIRYLENMVNSDYWRLIESTDDFREIGENILILTKELKLSSTLKEKIKELENEIENLKMKLSIYDSENRKLKHIVMSLPNGLEILEKL